jgi:demethylmenaquinone methyltransferase/2-methoxy-6-polyprenyl-1,4-benzoquinol methylase
MFDGISRRYDLLNRILSFTLDQGWRRAAAAEACPEPTQRVLDLCGGTGDLTVALARGPHAPGLVVCCDFSRAMLAKTASKFSGGTGRSVCVAVGGDALRLPFSDAVFDAVTIGFGVRNLADVSHGLVEVLRVLAPGGRLVVLELSRPTGPFLSRLHALYLRSIVPRLGDGASGRRGPYRYLARTIAEFPAPDLLAGTIREAGFAAVGWRTLAGGIVCLHTAIKGRHDATRPSPIA